MKPEPISQPVSPTKAPQAQPLPVKRSDPDRVERLVRAVETIALHAGAVAVAVMAANAHYKKTKAKGRGE